MTKFENLCNDYRENQRLIEMLTAENDNLKAEILALMGDRDDMTEGAARATNKPVTSSRFDSKRFKSEHGDLYSEYQTQSQYFRFKVV